MVTIPRRLLSTRHSLDGAKAHCTIDQAKGIALDGVGLGWASLLAF